MMTLRERQRHRHSARRRREAYLEVMQRAADLYEYADQVAPEVGLSAAELVDDGRRFGLRARGRGARTQPELRDIIVSGESPAALPAHGDEDTFALPSFYWMGPRVRSDGRSPGLTRVTLPEVLKRPMSGSPLFVPRQEKGAGGTRANRE